jgi:predicted RNase H-like nuclease (RuvC/YqgF family)
MQYLLEKTTLTENKIDELQQKIKDKAAEMDKLHEDLGELMMLMEYSHQNYKWKYNRKLDSHSLFCHVVFPFLKHHFPAL